MRACLNVMFLCLSQHINVWALQGELKNNQVSTQLVSDERLK